jgi:hypothetical protein
MAVDINLSYSGRLLSCGVFLHILTELQLEVIGLLRIQDVSFTSNDLFADIKPTICLTTWPSLTMLLSPMRTHLYEHLIRLHGLPRLHVVQLICMYVYSTPHYYCSLQLR